MWAHSLQKVFQVFREHRLSDVNGESATEAWMATNCWSQIRRTRQEVQKRITVTVCHLDAVNLVYSIDSDPGCGRHFSSGKIFVFILIMDHESLSNPKYYHWSHISRITPRSVWESFWNLAKWMGQFCRCFHLSRLVVNIWAIKMCKSSGCVLGESDVADTEKKKVAVWI